MFAFLLLRHCRETEPSIHLLRQFIPFDYV